MQGIVWDTGWNALCAGIRWNVMCDTRWDDMWKTGWDDMWNIGWDAIWGLELSTVDGQLS